MLAKFTITKAKFPKKKSLFITKQFHPTITFTKQLSKSQKNKEKPEKIKLQITKKMQVSKDSKKEKEKETKTEKNDTKLFETIEKEQKNDKIILPKIPCNLFCIFHNQPNVEVHIPKKPEPLLKKKRIIDEETGNSIGRWSPNEHKKFIEAIIKFGNNWKQVQDYIDTRTSTQARSHAQKFFEKIRKNKILKNFKALNTEHSDNFTNATIVQLHELYGNKTKNEINSIVNKFLQYEYDNQKKRRRTVHPFIGNKKHKPSSNNKKYLQSIEINEYDDDNNIEKDSNKNIDDKNSINNNINNNEESNNLGPKEVEYSEIYNNYLNKDMALNYKRDGIEYIIDQLVKNISNNCCDYDQNDIKARNKRKDTFGYMEEDESNLPDDYLGYNNLNYNNYNNINNLNNINNQNQNYSIVTRSRKNSLESRIKYPGIDDAKLSYDNNDFIYKNIFEDEKILNISE